MKIPATWDIPEEIRNRLGLKSSGKQRAMFSDGHLLLVLHQAPEPDNPKREGIFFWRTPEGRWECSKGGVGIQKLMNHLKQYQLEQEKLIEQYEIAKSATDYFQILEALAPLNLATKNLHITLQSARELIPDDRDLIDLRDWAYEIERTLDLIYLNTKNALDFKIAQESEAQARLGLESLQASNRLNTLAAIFFPLTAISCVFGMNLTTGFEATSPVLFWIILLAGIFLGFSVRQWVCTGKFRKF